MRLGALAGHQDLRVHPDRKAARLNADHRAHTRHAAGPDGDNLPRAHQALVNSFPGPVRRGVACARRGSPLASKPGADEMVLGKKPLEIFVGLSYIAHKLQSP
jgi:hypothetical protein